MRSTLVRSARFVLAASVLLGGAIPSAAQDGSKTCEQQLREAQEKLRQAENKIKDLQRELDRVRKEKAGGAGGSGGGTPANAAPADPLSSPAALYDALVDEYDKRLGSLPRESKPEIAKYHAAVKDWVKDAAKAHRGSIEWKIKVEKLESGSKPSLTFVVLDFADKPTGPAVTQPLPAKLVKDFGKDWAKTTYSILGTMGARPVHNPQRAEKGPSSTPMFIGPFAEFDFDLVIQEVYEAK
jgi:hypothetical protein